MGCPPSHVSTPDLETEILREGGVTIPTPRPDFLAIVPDPSPGPGPDPNPTPGPAPRPRLVRRAGAPPGRESPCPAPGGRESPGPSLTPRSLVGSCNVLPCVHVFLLRVLLVERAGRELFYPSAALACSAMQKKYHPYRCLFEKMLYIYNSGGHKPPSTNTLHHELQVRKRSHLHHYRQGQR